MPLTSKNRVLIAVIVLLCVAASAAGVYLYRMRRPLPAANAGRAPNILSELPPDAPVLAYVDVAALRRLQGTSLAALLGIAQPGPQADRDYQEFVRDTGFDYTRDLDITAIAFWPANVFIPAGQMGENKVVAIGEGRFDRQKIEAYALRNGKVVTRGTESLYEVPGAPPVAFKFLSASRIEIASGKDPASLISLPSAGGPDAAMQARINRVAGAPIFAVARTDNLPNSFYTNFRNSHQLESMVRSIRGLTLAGQPDRGDIKTVLDAECDSITDAAEISTLLEGFRIVGSMTLADPKERGQMTREQAAFVIALLNKTKVTHQDHWVRLTLDITPAMLAWSTSGH